MLSVSVHQTTATLFAWICTHWNCTVAFIWIYPSAFQPSISNFLFHSLDSWYSDDNAG